MILRSFTPTWHPPIAQSYFELYNDLNHTNNILYYDTTSSFISYPKIFTYKRINNTYGFQLYKVITNTSSDNPTFNPSLPAIQGTFTINKIVADSGNTSPSIDLYFKGTIQYEMDYNCDYPEGVGYNTYSASISPNMFPSDSAITVTYGYYNRFVLPDYSYLGDRVVISCNWSTTKRTVYQASGSVTLPTPTEALTINKGIVPIVYIDNWISTDYNPPSPTEEWDAVAVGDHATYDEDTGKYISLFNGTDVYVYGVSGDQRHCSWEVWDNWYGVYEWITVSAWISKTWIDPQDNPN